MLAHGPPQMEMGGGRASKTRPHRCTLVLRWSCHCVVSHGGPFGLGGLCLRSWAGPVTSLSSRHRPRALPRHPGGRPRHMGRRGQPPPPLLMPRGTAPVLWALREGRGVWGSPTPGAMCPGGPGQGRGPGGGGGTAQRAPRPIPPSHPHRSLRHPLHNASAFSAGTPPPSLCPGSGLAQDKHSPYAH